MIIENNTKFEAEAMSFYLEPYKDILTIVVKVTYEFSHERITLAKKQLPVLFADELLDPEKTHAIKAESDMIPFKPKADIVLVGTAYAPEGNSFSFISKLKVENTEKSIQVFGNRYWEHSSQDYKISERQPIKQISLLYENSFGGIDLTKGGFCEQNHVGKGYISHNALNISDIELPNIEDPNNLIQKWKDHPNPTNLCWSPRSSKSRIAFLGTYDENWRKNRSPLPPKDFNPAYHNGANIDLQTEYIKGSQTISLENLVPNQPYIEFELPEDKITCIVSKETEISVNMNCDTLCLIPNEGILYKVWRGFCPIKDTYGLEIQSVRLT